MNTWNKPRALHLLLSAVSMAALLSMGGYVSVACAQEAAPLPAKPIQSAPSISPGALALLQNPSLAVAAPVGGNLPSTTSASLPSSAPVSAAPNPLAGFSAATQLAVSNVFSDGILPTPGELESDFGWMIQLNDRPNGILLQQVRADASVLLVDIPTAQEIQMQMPGRMLDQADNARYQVVQYFNTRTQEAGKVRNGQAENMQAWVNYVKTLHLKLSSDPWQRWYFGVMVQAYLRPIYAQLYEQSKAPDAQMLKTAQDYVERITPLLSAAGTQEARVAWYGVLLQFKQGLGAYRQQVRQSDAKALDLIKEYMQQYPTPTKPTGDKPKRKASNENATTPQGPSVSVAIKKEANDAKPAPVLLKDASSPTGALIVTGLVLIVGVYFYMKIRQRLKKKTKPA